MPVPGRPALNRIVRATLVALLIGALTALGAVAPVAARVPVPKVALIVGTVADITPSYRRLAEQAAAVAEAAGAEVVRVYSPNATWSAVRAATEDASIVVYLGHGNGFPSRYRDELYPPTQNGFGLNPVAGIDDAAHQYFGEAWIERLHLAPNAVVLLHHLCYASGNTEPGLAEGTRAEALARVDNYASGFLRAGARAVVAEAHLGPAYYVSALLAGRRTIEQIWRASPERHGNDFAAPSVRSAGYTARLDPDRASGGYFRSLVSRGGLSAAEVRASGLGRAGISTAVAPVEPSLSGLGLRFGTPSVAAVPVAGAASRLVLPLTRKELRQLPEGVGIGVRWDPILLDALPPPADGAAPAAGDGTPADAVPAEPPAVELVAPEQLGQVVEVGAGRRVKGGLGVDVAYPAAPGLYRLVPTLHAPGGLAYDAATQALLRPLIVRVAGPVSAGYGVTPDLSVSAGGSAILGVRVANTGTERWDRVVTGTETRVAEEDVAPRPVTLLPELVATWVSADGRTVPGAIRVVLGAAAAGPGGESIAELALTAPAEPGAYLLVLDVVSPSVGPVSAKGSAPAVVRVTVSEAAEAPPVVEAPAPPVSPLLRRGG